MQHCCEQVEELQASEFEKSISEKVWENHASVKRKVVLVHALKKHGEQIIRNLEPDRSGQLHAMAALS